MQIRWRHGFFKVENCFALAEVIDENVKGALYFDAADKECCNLVVQLIIHHEHITMDKYEIRPTNIL